MINDIADLNAVFKRIPLLSPFQVNDFKVSQLAGFTNYNFHLKNAAHDWVLRIPKKQTNQFINRTFEASNVDAVTPLGFAPEIVWRDDSGLSLTTNCSQARPFTLDDMRNESTLTSLVKCIACLHKSNFKFYGEWDLTRLITQHFSQLPEGSVSLFKPYRQIALEKLSMFEKIELHKVPSHNDLVLENLLLQNDQRIWIIDWEYSALTSPYWDLATLCNTARFDATQNQHLLDLYRVEAFDLDARILRDYQYVLQFLSACWMATFSDQQPGAGLAWLDQIAM